MANARESQESVPSRTKSIFQLKCPRCYHGSLFYQPFSIRTAYKMPHSCSHCDQVFEPEPGFYYGAMFISYIIAGWVYLGIALALVFAAGWSAEAAIGVVILFALVTNIYLYRLARSVWIHIIVKFDPALYARGLQKKSI